jgi:hypothetical protein
MITQNIYSPSAVTADDERAKNEKGKEHTCVERVPLFLSVIIYNYRIVQFEMRERRE